MKVVDAKWEMRNLGKRTFELTLEDEDFKKTPNQICESINKIKSENKSEYTVVKIRCGNPFIGHELIKNGFFQMEMQFHIKAVKKDIETAAKRYGHFFSNTKLQEVNDEDSRQHILSEIRKGIFFTDRIALDPEFGVEIANKRYANWTADEIARGSSLSYVVANDERIGFCLHKYEKSKSYGLLSGLFNKYKEMNLGGNIFFTELVHEVNKGYKFFESAVSSNNIVALRVNEMFGYRVEGVYEVYVKHDKY